MQKNKRIKKIKNTILLNRMPNLLKRETKRGCNYEKKKN